METIILATSNPDKAIELKKLLNHDFEVVTMKDLGIDIDIIEDGKTFKENALIKVRTLNQLIVGRDGIIIGDDSGLSVDALGGKPGVYSARYAGDKVTYQDNNDKLLKEMEAVPDDQRGAEFITVVAILFPEGKEVICQGIVRGRIARDFIGRGGFGYDPLFIHEKTGRSYGEMSDDEKNAISHRAIAIQMVKEVLLKNKRNE